MKFSKFFGNLNEKYLKEIQPIIEKINSYENEFEKLSDSQLKEKTLFLKQELKNGKTLDDILPESFALVREASKRTLNQRHFDVQLIGGIVLHQGKIAEMKTGEGKTLTATLPLFLNALEGKGCHLVTVNDYLAKRDTVWMGQIYDFLGLSVACIVHDSAYIYDKNYKNQEKDKERDLVGGFKVVESYLRNVSRKEAYAADITYGTNNEFGFDYLRDNLVYDIEDEVQRGFNYAIVDEVDSILIDEARTPLIISGQTDESTDKYYQFAQIVKNLKEQEDYLIDEKFKSVSFTEEGQNKIVKSLGFDPWAENDISTAFQLEAALKAKTLFKRDKDYVVKDGEVIIVDEFTGRLMPKRRWSEGLHQAIEAKEGIKIQPESKTFATITFQNYFRMYKKLSGMTGTAATSAEEFDKVYKLEVVSIPTNKKMIRVDLADRVYKTIDGKFRAVVKEIKERNQKGQPILVGTVSIEKNEYLSKLLSIEGISHQVLNAKNHEREAEIIAQAGKLNAVTIATNMAGRGVDIILGGNPPDEKEANDVRKLGGLFVIGTERHESRRIDNQLRGRAGRQGDPGASQFFLSLEDDLLRIFGGDRIKSLMDRVKIDEDQPIEANIISKAIESAQEKVEGLNFDLRKHLLEYDDVMNKHREVFYKKRKEILLNYKNSTLKNYVIEIVKKAGYSEEDYINKEKEIGEENMREVERFVCLKTLDTLWIEHLEDMEYLRDAVKLRAYGQKDPLVEYKREAHQMFKKLLETIDFNIAKFIFQAQLKPQNEKINLIKNSSQNTDFNSKEKKVGRNDPCPCGSGKKYKKCCGK
ncbi:MAG TPA: preprotein translocase subunit SecA [Candidatus Pacearchaeota archaeon]|nr:preprotein translocase subunit SecA [Candidatus Pacearchaeota archaeon]HPO68513.1 preprotein translocase subunit SecA [Candidatus Pacearchaeota archaeon]